MVETIINSEAFLIIISGVLIFTFQKLFSQLWILPVVDFKKCLAKIETLLNRYAFLYAFEYGANNRMMDSDIEYFRKELKNLTSEMLGNYYVLPCLMKIWFKKIRNINIHKAKSEILTLSAVVSTHKDISREKSKAEISIENIPKYLNFSQIKYKMADM
ncbi:MAG: hypothetical protein U9N04_03495 [Patescibacteria group bacterium]|nr:hypothetical protein [Patescibacteria group bacterium]